MGAVFDNGRIKIAEKDVVLAIAQEAAAQIRSRGIRAVLTRARDVNLSLQERTAAANKIKADAFISLHMNSTQIPMSNDAEGVETYILNRTSDASSKRLAHFENSVLGGSPKAENAEGKEDLDLSLILKDLRLDGNTPESKRLACAIQKELTRPGSNQKNRGVKQALFYVLLGADMPSALVEAGFMTNRQDRERVTTLAGRRSIGKAIADAITQFSQFKGTDRAKQDTLDCRVK